jgi:hypothetical protein
LIQSEEGEPLATDTYSGSFTTAAGQGGGGDCDPDGVSDDWGTYSLSKNGSYGQTSAADPVPLAEDPFALYVGVMGPQAGPAVTGGFLALPNGGNRPLQGFGTAYFFTESAATEAAIDTAYPAGNYALHFSQTGQPERVIAMNMPAANVPVPKIINFADAQAVNANLNFNLQWNPFTGAGANDHLSLVISDAQSGVVFEAPDLCVPRELPVTATSVILPAGTLQMDKTYHASLTFMRTFYFVTNAVPSMAGFGALSKSTEFTVKTGTGGGGGGAPARFTGYRLLPGGETEMDLTGTTAASYTIQRTSNLLLQGWQPVGVVIMDAAGKTTFRDTDGGKIMPLFYRAVTN